MVELRKERREKLILFYPLYLNNKTFKGVIVSVNS